MTRPLIIRARVDLPEPLAPTMPIRCSVERQVDAVQHRPARRTGDALPVKRISATPVSASGRSSSIARPWPPPIAQAARPSPGPSVAQHPGRQPEQQDRAGRAPRVPEPDRAALARTPGPRPGRARRSTASTTRRERLGDLDGADVGQRSAAGDGRPVSSRRTAGAGAEPGQVRVARRRRPRRRSAGRAVRPRRGAACGGHRDRGGAVGDAAGVAGGRGAVRAERGPQPGQPALRPARRAAARRRETSCTATISASNAPACWAAKVSACDRAAYSSWRCPGDPAAPGQRVGGLAHVRVRVAARGERRPGVAHAAPRRPTGGQNRHGAVLADSAPPASTSSASPARDPGGGLQHRVQPGPALPVDGHPGHRGRRARRPAPRPGRCCRRGRGSCR